MKTKTLFLVTLIFFINCSHKKSNNEPEIDCYIGRIKLIEYPSFDSYNIYASLKIKNNTKDTIYIPPYDSFRIYYYEKSYFIGQIESDTIHFEQLTDHRILPNDSVRVLLIRQLYKPKVADSLFIKEIKNMNIEYSYKNEEEDKETTIFNYIRDIKIQKTNHTRFEKLDDYAGIEAFEFGNLEFE